MAIPGGGVDWCPPIDLTITGETNPLSKDLIQQTYDALKRASQVECGKCGELFTPPFKEATLCGRCHRAAKQRFRAK